jgi:hypothetical protein
LATNEKEKVIERYGDSRRSIPYEEAEQEVAAASRRWGLLALSYAKTLIEELGEDRGLELIAKAMIDYGTRIGEKAKQETLAKGLKPTPENFFLSHPSQYFRTPSFGTHACPVGCASVVEVDDQRRTRIYGCQLAQVWKDYGSEGLKYGRLYCYVDPAKFMGYNPNYALVHTKCVADGDPYCELVVRPTSERERNDFKAKSKDWLYVDPPKWMIYQNPARESAD